MDRNSENAAKYKLVANSIRQYIVVNRLGSGAKLPGGRFFANKYGVSKNTIYEALGLLEDKGILDIRENSGTYVSATMLNNLESKFANYIKRGWQTSDYYPLLELAQKASDINSIYLGLASLHEEFGYKQLLEDCLLSHIDKNQLSKKLDQYDVMGSLSFRTLLSNRLEKENIYANPSEILVTNGVYSSIDMLIKVLLSAGDTVFTESSSTLKMFLQAKEIGINIVELSVDEYGICIEDLKRKIKKAKRAVLIASIDRNGLSDASTSHDRIIDISDLCISNNVPIIELGKTLYMNTSNESTFKSIANEHCIYIDGIAYPYSLGLDIAWVAAPKDIMEQLAMLYTRIHHYPFNLNNLIVEEILSNGSYDKFVSELPIKIEKRIEDTNDILTKYLSDYATWSLTSSNRSIIIKMNENIDMKKLHIKSNAYGVVFPPGELFGEGYLRCVVIAPLSVSLFDLEEGIKRFKNLVESVAK